MNSLTLVAIGLLAITAAVFDLNWRRIPNLLSILSLILGLILSISGDGWMGFRLSLAGIGLALFFLPGYLLGFTGGGDLKLAAAFGSLLGAPLMLHALMISVMVAAVWGLAAAIWAWATRGAPLPFARYAAMLRELITTGRLVYRRPQRGEAFGLRIPLAPALGIGSVAAALMG